jgi:hypothetical protein
LPDEFYIDGGLSKDHVPYNGLIDFINSRGFSVEKVIIVSRKSDLEPDISEELATIGITDKRFFDKSGISLDEILYKGFIKGLKNLQIEAPDLASKTVVYIPTFDEKFLLLNFNDLKSQYDVTRRWAKKNKPIPLEEYLKNNN